MAKKFYAVKKGYTRGIFYNWEDCKKQIEGYSGAIYKGFTSLEDANRFLDSGDNESDDTTDLIAYVDGSYNICTKEFSYGMIILNGDSEEYFSEKYNDPELAVMRNVAGEIMGSMSAMEYCLFKGFKSITIYYDYEGIEKWCNGYWKTNKIGTKRYKEYYENIKNKIHIIFKKVKAHSGDKYNDIADKLAKKALGIIE